MTVALPFDMAATYITGLLVTPVLASIYSRLLK